MDISGLPLFTDTILPAWQVKPPLERLYGGSAKIMSKESSGNLFKNSCNRPNKVQNHYL
jgi:hypothetical protein